MITVISGINFKEMKRLSALIILACLLGIGGVFAHSTKAAAAACTNKTNGCTNEITLTINVNLVDSSGNNVTDPSKVAPSTADVTVEDQDSAPNQLGSATSDAKPTFTGSVATYTVHVPSFQLTTTQDTQDYPTGSDGGNNSVVVCVPNLLNTEAEQASGSECTKIDPSSTDLSNPNDVIGITITGASEVNTAATATPAPNTGVSAPSGCEGSTQTGALATGTTCPATTYPTGCYPTGSVPNPPGEAETPVTCPAGAVDNQGNPVNGKLNCYVQESGPLAAGETSLPWDAVSCSDLKTAVTTSTGGGTGTTTTAPSTCDAGNFALDWLLCPIVEKIQDAVSAVTKYIESQLNVSVNDYFDDGCINSATATGVVDTATYNSCNATNVDYDLWADFRDIALTVLVIAGLVMVFSQAMDFGPFDAYTVRKMLPKILMAVILITFSWEIGRFLVQFSDDLGVGVRQLILGVSPGALSNANTAVDLLVGGGVALAGGAVFAIALGPLALILILISVIVSLVVAFLVLVFRKLLIIICVIASPLAFVAYIMPGGQKIWGLWKKSFTGALLMFPMIIGVISLGQLFSYLEYQTATNQHGGSGFVPGLIAIVLYFGPFFLLPKIAKSSMGAMGAIVAGMHSITHGSGGGGAGGHGGGIMGGLKKSRQNAAATNRNRILTGQKSQKTAFGRGLNIVGVGLSTGGKGHFGVGKKGAAARTIKRGGNVEQTLKNVAGLAQLGSSDDNSNALLALSGGSSRNLSSVADEILAGQTFATPDARNTEKERMMRTVGTIGVNQATSQAALSTLAQNKSRAIKSGQYQLVEAGIKRASGQTFDAATNTWTGTAEQKHLEQDMAQTFQFYSRNAGRVDLGGDWTSDTVAGLATPDEKRDAIVMDGLSKTDLTTLARGYPAGAEQAAKTLQRRMQSTDINVRKEAAIRAIEMGVALPYATGGTADKINAGLAGPGLDIVAGQGSITDQLANKIYRAQAGVPIGPLTIAQQNELSLLKGELNAKARSIDREELMRSGGAATPPPTTP